MPDMEQVIWDIERCICHVPDACKDCSHYQKGEAAIDCMEILLADALALLKEQEARIRELEEKLRVLKYGDQDTLKSAMMPAT